MRYFLRDSTLFLRGAFRAASTGPGGGLAEVTTIFNHAVPKTFDHAEVSRYMGGIVAEQGFSNEYFGLLTAVPMQNLCILQYDFITVFVTAGVTCRNPAPPHTINVVVSSREGMADAALLETIITVTEAKAEALRSVGHAFTGTATDAVVVACEGDAPLHEFAGMLTEVGRRVYAAVLFGVCEALKRQEGAVHRSRPSFFIFSRYGGEHWVEWMPEACPYYPCHFEGQRCDFCYCPYYPCKDETLGEWVESSSGGKVWACTRCPLLHIPEVAEYVKRNPEASLTEVKRFSGRL